MIGHGMKVSELIEKLKELRNEHGNVEVWICGGDYPEGVTYVKYFDNSIKRDGYYPKICIKLN